MRGFRRKYVWSGALLALLLFYSGNAGAQPLGIMSQRSESAPRHDVLSANDGRYVFGPVSDSAKDQFMLDTWTGRLWHLVESGDVGRYLREVPYRTGTNAYVPMPGEVTEKPEKESKE